MMAALPGLSLVIPTYRREQVLLDTIRRMHDLDPAPDEILVVDQTERHEPPTEEALQHLHDEGWIRLIRLPEPSIPHAMNTGLLEARHEIVLFTDDDVVPAKNLAAAHRATQAEEGVGLVAGAVIQPWDRDVPPEQRNQTISGFSLGRKRWIEEFIGCNFSIRRELALSLGGFDENFVKAAYRFEKEFADRLLASGSHILFEPDAVLDHLHEREGGTRTYGDFQRTVKPGHAVGEYYYLLRTRSVAGALAGSFRRLLSSVISRWHLLAPWWIPITLIAETVAFFWAILLAVRGPRLLSPP